jgi:hypothetical protein
MAQMQIGGNMSHLTVELHENYPHERISDWEHEFVRNELATIGFNSGASTRGTDERLPRACYFSTAGTYDAVRGVWNQLERRLSRKVSIECTIGTSYGFGLKPLVDPADSYGSLFGMVAPLSTAFGAIPALSPPSSSNFDFVAMLSGSKPK